MPRYEGRHSAPDAAPHASSTTRTARLRRALVRPAAGVGAVAVAVVTAGAGLASSGPSHPGQSLGASVAGHSSDAPTASARRVAELAASRSARSASRSSLREHRRERALAAEAEARHVAERKRKAEQRRKAERKRKAEKRRRAERALAAAQSDPKSVARRLMGEYGFSSGQWGCLEQLWTGESGWDYTATNSSSGAYGIPQALPGGKMASVAGDWKTNPETQIRWGLDYIKSSYGTPCNALQTWNSHSPHWY